MGIIVYVRLISFRRFVLFESVVRSLTFEVVHWASLFSYVVFVALVNMSVKAMNIDYLSIIFNWRFVLSRSVLCLQILEL